MILNLLLQCFSYETSSFKSCTFPSLNHLILFYFQVFKRALFRTATQKNEQTPLLQQKGNFSDILVIFFNKICFLSMLAGYPTRYLIIIFGR